MLSNVSKAIRSLRRGAPAVERSIRLAGVAAAMLTMSACATVPSGGSAMRDGGVVMPPAGWMDFCGRNVEDPSCKVVQLDDARWHRLQAIQASLRSVRRVDDQIALGRPEYWQVATKAGDCEDIALAARQRLLGEGWPASAVRLATAWTEGGTYHTVLTVDGVRKGASVTYVLDSRFAVVLSYQELEQLGYRFDMRQAARGPNWVSIRS